MRNVLRKANKVSLAIAELDFLLRYLDNLALGTRQYFPNYPDHFVKKIIKAAEINEAEIEEVFIVGSHRAKMYRYCQNVSPQTKQELVRYALRKMLKG